jgi:uncharacterized protein YlxW (UPF0749 family)
MSGRDEEHRGEDLDPSVQDVDGSERGDGRRDAAGTPPGELPESASEAAPGDTADDAPDPAEVPEAAGPAGAAEPDRTGAVEAELAAVSSGDDGPDGGEDSPQEAPDPLDLSVPVTALDDLPDDELDDSESTSPVGQSDPPPDSERSFDDVVLERPQDSVDEAGSPADPAASDRDAVPVRPTGWRALSAAMRPRLNRSQVLAGLLCGALGFALVVQVQQSAQDPLTSARQDDLVRLLDEVTQRADQLDEEVAELTRTRDELASGTGQAQAAVELAEQRAQSEGILSGRLPAVGPGLEIVVRDPAGVLPAAKLFNVLEELRNAGAEVVELNGIRLVTSSWFLDTDAGVTVDGQAIESPYRWTVIGDPATLNPALEIPGGALAQIRTEDVEARTVDHDEVEVTAVREPGEPQYATPSDPNG